MKTRALLVVTLLVVLVSGCATTGPETTVTGFQKISASENKKVALSLFVIVEKDMETIKNTPDDTEKAVADEVHTKLRENINQKGLLADKVSASFGLDLRVHYVSRMFAEWEYFGSRILTNRGGGGQILLAQAILKSKDNKIVAQIDSINNWPIVYGPQRIIEETSAELAAQIEKILKEGIAVGKTQTP